jgi:hypothetical protein
MKKFLFIALVPCLLSAEPKITGYTLGVFPTAKCDTVSLYKKYKSKAPDLGPAISACFNLPKVVAYMQRMCGDMHIDSHICFDDSLWPEIVLECGTDEQREMLDMED